jgi:transposase
MDDIDAVTWKRLLESRKPSAGRLEANPSAYSNYAREAGAPWRRKGELEIDADNEKARKELWRKRLNALARQTCTGLETAFGIKQDYTSFASYLAEAYKTKEKLASAEASRAAGAGGGAESVTSKMTTAELRQRDEERKPVLVLDAVLKFDLPRVKDLLGLRVKDRSDATLTV